MQFMTAWRNAHL